MIIVSIDLSTKPGYAIRKDGELIKYGTLFGDKTVQEFGTYPLNYYMWAEHVTMRIIRELIDPLPCIEKITVVLEETTASSQNYSQKILEFLHCLLLQKLMRYPDNIVRIAYIRDGTWKRLVGANQNREERNHNARLSRYKKKHGKKIGKLKNAEGELKRARKLGPKDYALRALKERLAIELPREMEDACDAILLMEAYLMEGTPICDGTILGGLLTEDLKGAILANEESTDTSPENQSPESEV